MDDKERIDWELLGLLTYKDMAQWCYRGWNLVDLGYIKPTKLADLFPIREGSGQVFLPDTFHGRNPANHLTNNLSHCLQSFVYITCGWLDFWTINSITRWALGHDTTTDTLLLRAHGACGRRVLTVPSRFLRSCGMNDRAVKSGVSDMSNEKSLVLYCPAM